MADLRTRLAGRSLANPVMTAAGCGGTGRDLGRFLDMSGLGAFVTASLTGAPRTGTGTPRTAETPSGVLTTDGLVSPGVGAFLERELPWLRSVGATVIVSVAGSSSTEYADVAAALRDSPDVDCVAGVEVNLSCANEANHGIVVGTDPQAAGKVVALVREQVPRDVLLAAKLAADVTDVVAVAAACIRAGADVLTTTNALRGLAIDPTTLHPRLADTTGGLSGPAIRPMALASVWQLRRAMDEGRLPTVPVIGVGGIRTGRDALEFLAAGATAVQVGAATINDPGAPRRVTEELADLLARMGVDSPARVVGTAHVHARPRTPGPRPGGRE